MFNVDKNTILTMAKKYDCNSSYLEKAMRLSEIIDYLSFAEPFYHTLVLKGGPAINLTVLGLKRLFIGLKFDFDSDVSDKELVTARKNIMDSMLNYMVTEGYYSTSNTKSVGSADFFEFTYQNVSGTTDYIKMSIEYGMRLHIFPPEERLESNDITTNGLVYTLKKEELIGQLIADALINEDILSVYDIICLIDSNLITQEEFEVIQKCFIFYFIVAGKNYEINEKVISFKEKFLSTSDLTFENTLKPVLLGEKRCCIDTVNEKINNLFNVFLDMNIHEKQFIEHYQKNQRCFPSLVFASEEVYERLIKYNIDISSNTDVSSKQ